MAIKKKNKSILIARHLLLQAIRNFFFKQGLIEIQAPVSSFHAIPEASIELFTIKVNNTSKYLLPSPEIYLKPLLSLELDGFFHIGPAFRKNELGQFHLAEFTILEWYRANSTYEDLITDCLNLIDVSYSALKNSLSILDNISLSKFDILNPVILTIEKAFLEFAGWNPILEKNEKRFDEDLAFKIEPKLPKDRPVFLKDYPIWAGSLSKKKEDNKEICERVELYLNGIELANGFSELLNPKEQRERFLKENEKRKKLGLPPIPIPENFLSSLENCPPSSGMALGIDRFLMILLNLKDIKEVVL